MICQAPTRLPLAVMLAGLLAGCQSDPQLSHRQISSSTRSKLLAISRAPTSKEYSNNTFQVDALISGTGAATVPMRLETGIPTVPASINGRKAIPMIVDTGAQACLMEARTAVAHRVITLQEGKPVITVAGIGGREHALFGVPDSVKIGDLLLEKFPFFVRTHETHVKYSLWKQYIFSYDILGMNAVLPRCDYLTLDFPAKQMVFGLAQTFTPPVGKKVWKAPLVIRDRLPYVQLHTSGKTWQALIDTGFDGLLHMNEATAKRLGLQDKARPVKMLRAGVGVPANAKQLTEFGLVNLPGLASLGPKMTNIPTFIIPETSKIGCALLKPFRITLDFKRHLLWLEDVSSR